MSYDWEGFVNLIVLLLEGTKVSVMVFFLTLFFAIPLGLLVAFGRMSRFRLISGPIKIYILLMRGTPLILQIALVYFGPYYLLPEGMKINLDRFVAAVAACTLNYAAYFAEIYRGGIQSIPKGQYEAAAVLGFSKIQTFMHIILPQVVKRILPPMGNEIITLVKDTALVQTIGISELFRVATVQDSAKSSTIPLAAAGIFYLIMNWVVTEALQMAENKLNYYR